MSKNTFSLMHLRSYSGEIYAHSHDYYQWVLPIEGALELEINKQSNRVEHNKGAFIRPTELHSYASYNHNEFLVLNILPQRWMVKMDIPPFWELSPALEHYLRFAKYYLVQQQNDRIANALIKDFLLKLLTQNFLSQLDQRVLVAKNWIDVHFAEPINLKLLALECCLSVSQLQRRFKDALGQTIADYWRTVRLQQAQFLLKKRMSTIDHIAHDVGYESSAAFSRSFSRLFGISPSKWYDDASCKKDDFLG